MRVSSRVSEDGIWVITIKGKKLRESDALEVRRDILDLINQIRGTPKVILDLKKVKLVDPSGFTSLAVISMKVAQRRGRIVLARVNDDVKNNMAEMSLVDAFGGVYGDVEQALKSFTAPSSQ